MIKYGFFNAKATITGNYDRKYNSEDVNKFFEGCFSRDGIYKFVGNQCRVISGGGNSVLVQTGKGFINYHWFKIDANELVTLSDAHPTLPRYDAIVMRYDENNRYIYLATKEGTPAENPVKPTIDKGETIREICLTYIKRNAGATEILESDIIDTIEDSSVCGFVLSLPETSSGGGVIKVDRLPIATGSELGKIYYLTTDYTEGGKTYNKDFYKVIILSYSYRLIDVMSISDIKANIPTASSEYKDVVFYATDEDKFYVCKADNDNYDWIEISVTSVDVFPEASIETKDKYYVCEDMIKKGIEEGDVYDWVNFKGGSSTVFAIIQVGYPEDDKKPVVTDGDGKTQTAPDTSGLWLCTVPAAGTYTVSYGTATPQEVAINTKGQVESVYVSEQVVNYEILYLLGDENSKVTGGWSAINGSAGGGYGRYCFYKPNIPIKLRGEYTKLLYTGELIKKGVAGTTYKAEVGFNNYTVNGYDVGTIGTVTMANGTTAPSSILFSKVYNISNISGETNIYICTTDRMQHNSSSSWGSNYSNSKLSNRLRNNISYSNLSVEIDYLTLYTYCIAIGKIDDISGLSDYGSTIQEIIQTNAVDLFNDRSALQYMAQNCTGDLMLSAVSNTYFKAAYNASENKDILLANEHWAKFIPLMNYI